MPRASIILDAQTHKRAKLAAKADDKTLTRWVEALIKDRLAHNKKEKSKA